MGEVYRARDRRLGREVAIKVLAPGSSHDPERLRRFEQEAKAVGALSHPNLLTVHDVGQHEGLPYIVFELLVGETMRHRLGPGALPVSKALDYAIQIAQGLAAAHERGIVHRDLKPENLFVTEDGRVKILDFGLAKLRPALDPEDMTADAATASEITAAGTAMGTAGYMSPELVQGHRADQRSDIFSLGAVLYEMLSGRRAFQRDSTVETMAAILKEEPPELPTIQPDIAPYLDRVVRRCLQKRAEDRFQSVRDAAFALAVAARVSPLAWAAVASVLAVVLLASWRLRPRPTPQIVGSTQLTFTGNVAAPFMYGGAPQSLLTDGARIYFQNMPDFSGLGVAHVSTAGGEVVILTTPFQYAIPLALSPDGHRILLRETSLSHSEGALWVMPTSGGAPQPLGDVVAQDATWSLDGKHLAYARGEELYMADRDGRGPRKLVTTRDRAYWIRFSPDGRHLRFTIVDSKTQRGSLWDVSVDGRDLHALPLEWDEPSHECCGEWSRDGSQFVFTAFHDEGADLWLVDEGGLFPSGKKKAQRLTSDSFDSVAAIPSADGKKLHAVESRGSLQMLKYDPRSRQFTLFPLRRVRQVRFSGDGQWLAYVELRGRKPTLIRSRLDGSQALQLTMPPMEFWDAHWSPDGKEIAFVGKLPGEPYQAYVVPRDGGAPRPVLPDGRNQIDLDWSPDGRSLMFGRPPDSMAKEVERAIHIVDLKSNQVATLPGSEGLFSPRCSPDARRVVTMPGDQHKLVLFDFKAAAWRDLAGPGIGAGLADVCLPFCHNPQWSLDGRHVYFESGPQRASRGGGGPQSGAGGGGGGPAERERFLRWSHARRLGPARDVSEKQRHPRAGLARAVMLAITGCVRGNGRGVMRLTLV